LQRLNLTFNYGYQITLYISLDYTVEKTTLLSKHICGLSWRRRREAPPRRRFSYTYVHAKMSQKSGIFIITTVRTWNLAAYELRPSAFTFSAFPPFG